STEMIPYNVRNTQTLSFKDQYIDFSQIPFIVRTLDFSKHSEYNFSSINPRSNTPASVAVKALGDSTIDTIACFAIELSTFEGIATYWIEKKAPHRVILIEEATTKRKTELIL
ncbi:MAG TPA: hypothetical protein VMU30_09560, partial [Bacteroidota bacterium]|nr:hypothetical protein [Bacteroidota bacterium]